MALESGDRDSHESYRSSKRKTYKGQLRAYIEINDKAEDDVKIEMTSEEFGKEKLTIKKVSE